MNDPLTGGPIDPCELYPLKPAAAPVWTTRDGRKVLLTDMTVEHLSNAARLLRRAARNQEALALGAWCAMGTFQGEMAQDAVGYEAKVHESAADRCVAWARLMEAELARRGEAVARV